MERAGIYIMDINGLEVEVTDLEKAIIQAKQGVTFNETKIEIHKTDQTEIVFPEALKYWQHALLELEKVEIKTNSIKKEIKKTIEDKYPKDVMEARAYWGKCKVEEFRFIRNGRKSPLYGLSSNWLFMDNEVRLRMLKIGESTYNSSGTKITRIF